MTKNKSSDSFRTAAAEVVDPEVTHALAQPAETALAVSGADAQAMYGTMETESFTVPRLVVLEGLSPQVSDGLGRPGDLFVSGLNRNLGQGPLELVILRRWTSRNRWKPLADGGGILCKAEDAKMGVGDPGGECAVCPRKDWFTNADQKRMPPTCDQTENYMVVLRSELQSGDAFPMVVSGSRARLREFKSLNTLLLGLIQRKRLLCSKSFLLTIMTKTSQTVKNAQYHVFSFQPGNENALLPAAEQGAALDLFKTFATARVADPDPISTEATETPF